MPAGGTTRTSYRTLVPKLFKDRYQIYLFIPHNDLAEHLNIETKVMTRLENYEKRRNSPKLTGRNRTLRGKSM